VLISLLLLFLSFPLSPTPNVQFHVRNTKISMKHCALRPNNIFLSCTVLIKPTLLQWAETYEWCIYQMAHVCLFLLHLYLSCIHADASFITNTKLPRCNRVFVLLSLFFYQYLFPYKKYNGFSDNNLFILFLCQHVSPTNVFANLGMCMQVFRMHGRGDVTTLESRLWGLDQ
jgi:hypothetical protein